MLKKILFSILALILVFLTVIYIKFFKVDNKDVVLLPKTQERSQDISSVEAITYTPTFTEIPSEFSHKYKIGGHVVAGGTLIDINGDNISEVFVSGGEGQQDALMFYENNKFVNKIEGTGLSNNSATYGSFAFDFNNDTKTDLFVARNNGITYYENLDGRSFNAIKLKVDIPDETIPLSITGGDINNDGFVDLYISAFITPLKMRSAVFNDKEHGKSNLLLLNDGKGNFKNIAKEAGVEFNQNTFISSIFDINNDGFQDILISPNTGKITIFKNNGNNTFTKIPSLTENGFWMGLTTSDIDNDGDIDIFASNSGNSIPVSASRGDLTSSQILDPEWRILRNDGDLKFTDITQKSKLLNYEFAWGAIFYDFNLDTIQDLFVLENYIKWPPHKFKKLAGRFFVGSKDAEKNIFLPTTKQSGVENFNYGMTALVSDWNKDGFPDMFIVNLDGPSRGFLNTSNKNKSITLNFPNNLKYMNAQIALTFTDGKKIYRQNNTSQGFLSTQGTEMIIGIGQENIVKQVNIITNDKKVKNFEDVKAFSVLQMID